MTPEEIAKAHWETYVGPLLEAHEEEQHVIDRIAFHYVSAFVHGYKHAVEDAKETARKAFPPNPVNPDFFKPMCSDRIGAGD